jgi:outer membrane murein-binding lipoprotein Lpp
MKRSPATHLVNKAIIEIQTLASSLDSINTDKLASDLRDLESKISALRSFLLDHIVRKA